MITIPKQAVMIIVASRCEVIKMAPIYHACKRAHIPVLLCVTLHNSLVEDALNLFGIKSDIVVTCQKDAESSLCSLQSILESIQPIIKIEQPALILVHGDSISSMAVAMAAFYATIPIAHVEAGLRIEDIHTLSYQEVQRRIITVVSTFHFAPTMTAVANILDQGVARDHVFCTGNTGIDALMIIKEKIMHKEIMVDTIFLDAITAWRKQDLSIGVIVLGGAEHTVQERVTLFSLIREIKNCAWIIVDQCVVNHANSLSHSGLLEDKNTVLVDNISYKNMVYILDNADIVLADSRAVEQEATSLGKPVLILRYKTERMEEILERQVHVVGFSPLLLMGGIEQALQGDQTRLSHVKQLYGDGHAAEKIVAFIQVRYPELVGAVGGCDDRYYQQSEAE